MGRKFGCVSVLEELGMSLLAAAYTKTGPDLV